MYNYNYNIFYLFIYLFTVPIGVCVCVCVWMMIGVVVGVRELASAKRCFGRIRKLGVSPSYMSCEARSCRRGRSEMMAACTARVVAFVHLPDIGGRFWPAQDHAPLLRVFGHWAPSGPTVTRRAGDGHLEWLQQTVCTSAV